MAERIPQSVAKLWVFRAFLSADGKTPATGKTIAITLSKNGATSFSNPNAGATNATEMASGFYKVTLDTTDTGTTGPLALKGSESTINDVGEVYEVANAHNAGFDALPNAAAEASGGLATLSAAQASNGTINANVHRWLTGTPNALQSGRVDGYVGALAAGVLAAASFAADYFTDIITAVWTTAAARILTAGTNIVLAKGTGVTGFNDLSAAQVNTEADTALADAGVTTTVTGRIDAAITTRATPAQVASELATYDAPTKAELDAAVAPLATASALATADAVADAIKLVTDKLDTALESDGGVYRYTTNALEQAPTSGGGTAPTVEEIRQEMDANSTKLDVSTGSLVTASTFNNAMNFLSLTLAALPADVRAEVIASLVNTTYPEVTGPPPAAASFARMWGQLYKHLINPHTVSVASDTLFNDDGSEDILAPLNDNSAVLTRGKWSAA